MVVALGWGRLCLILLRFPMTLTLFFPVGLLLGKEEVVFRVGIETHHSYKVVPPSIAVSIVSANLIKLSSSFVIPLKHHEARPRSQHTDPR